MAERGHATAGDHDNAPDARLTELLRSPAPTAYPALRELRRIRDGDLAKGNDVVTAPCDSSATQRWSVDASRGVLRSAADDDFCLDSRGSADRGVGIWECDSVHGRNGVNLRFTVGRDGTIRPAVATGTAVTPDDGDGVSLRALSGGRGQRWRAGAR
ncbi:hypothetical protein SHL15_3123 [Streptomyces hygroscopicus subsp. limoneus]|nr:hypothetical protein SHL15_3123 [Streptomyces hygroscopicus subsp. limoneus]